MYKLYLYPQRWICSLETDASVLESALLAGIQLPNSCRNGVCRACMCRKISGEIEYMIEWPGLSIEEKQEGWILPCVAQPRSDLSLESPLAKDGREKIHDKN